MIYILIIYFILFAYSIYLYYICTMKMSYKNKVKMYEYFEWIVKMQALSGICVFCTGTIMYFTMPNLSLNNYLMATSIFSMTMTFVAILIVATN